MNWNGRYLVIGFPAGIPRIPLNLAPVQQLRVQRPLPQDAIVACCRVRFKPYRMPTGFAQNRFDVSVGHIGTSLQRCEVGEARPQEPLKFGLHRAGNRAFWRTGEPSDLTVVPTERQQHRAIHVPLPVAKKAASQCSNQRFGGGARIILVGKAVWGCEEAALQVYRTPGQFLLRLLAHRYSSKCTRARATSASS